MEKALKNKHDNNLKNLSFKIGMLLALSFLIPGSYAATITVSDKIISESQSFELNVTIDPSGTPISGAQVDFAFNKSILRVNRIIEGNLFKQKGDITFFNGGSINNSSGTVVNIFDAIIGNSNVSIQGTFIIINMTAIGPTGTSRINLSNIKISDPNGFPVPFSIKNGNVTVVRSDSTPPASISSLSNTTYEKGYIRWSWNDPKDADFAKVMVYINSIFRTNVTKGVQIYNASDLIPDFRYTISTHTVDASGNINKTWINHTARTAQSITSLITIVSPNGGETWARKSKRTISWTSSGSSGTYVRIELMKGSVVNRVINSRTPNDGEYSWRVPATQTLANDYKVRITSIANSSYTDTSNSYFIISS